MRKKRRSNSLYNLDRRWLLGLVGLLVILAASINCTFDTTALNEQAAADTNDETEVSEAAVETKDPVSENLAAGSEDNQTMVLDEQLWADVGDDISTPRATHNSTDKISINVKDANLLDVFSMLAHKMGINIIFLEQPTQITLKTDNLSPITTLQIILQKEGFDYLTIGDNYIVGNRDRLYDDFADRMFLARYDLFYVSASDMESYIAELGMPVESLSVDSNQRALWMQGTPMTLGKAREIINALDVIDNASFAEGGGRKIRMPVAVARGEQAEEELEALIDFLSILLDGFRDGRTDMGWVTWDHPDPLPSIYMDWESPIIKPYDIKMKITRDFANNYSDPIRYLVAEGTPDNIDLVNQMISEIDVTPSTPFKPSTSVNINTASYEELQQIIHIDTVRARQIISLRPFGSINGLTRVDGIAEERLIEIKNEGIAYVGQAEGGGTDSVEWIPDNQQQSVSRPSYEISLIGVPESGGTLSGEGSYTEGSSVTITADPAEGYKFVRWIENGSEFSTSETYSFTIYGDRKLEAVFISGQNDSSSDSEDSNSDE